MGRQLGLEKECAAHLMGKKQRLVIAGALASDREIILLDLMNQPVV